MQSIFAVGSVDDRYYPDAIYSFWSTKEEAEDELNRLKAEDPNGYSWNHNQVVEYPFGVQSKDVINCKGF